MKVSTMYDAKIRGEIGREFIKLIKKTMDKEWDWVKLSENPNFTPDVIEENMDLPWDYDGLSENPSMTCEFIEKYIEKRWNWMRLSFNSCITGEFIEKHIWKPWNYMFLSAYAPLEMIEKYPNKKWKGSVISQNRYLTIEFIRAHPEIEWDWFYVSENKNFTIDIIRENMDLPWDFEIISGHNENVGINEIYENMDLPWNPESLIIHTELREKNYEDIPLDIIENYLEEFIEYGEIHDMHSTGVFLTEFNKLTIDFIESHSEIEWDWEMLTGHPAVTLEYIQEHPEIEWDFDTMIYKNPNITTEYIEETLFPMLFQRSDFQIERSLFYLSKNPCVTYDFIVKHIEKPWNYYSFIEYNPNFVIDKNNCNFKIVIGKIFDKLSREHFCSMKDMDVEFIHEYIHVPWLFNELSGYNFDEYYKKEYIIEEYRKLHKTIVKEVNKEFEELVYHPDNFKFLQKHQLFTTI